MPHNFEDNWARCVARIMQKAGLRLEFSAEFSKTSGTDYKQSNKLINMEIISHCCVAELFTAPLSPL